MKTKFFQQTGFLLSFLAILLLLTKVIFSLNIIWQIFNFSFQVDESESMIVAETLFMDRGIDIYAPLDGQRFIAAPYTPLYYLLNWPALHFLGSSFKPGRFISFLAWCGIAFLIYHLIRQLSLKSPPPVDAFHSRYSRFLNRLPAVLALLIWASLGLSAFWGATVKPDMLALFLSLCGLYAISTQPVVLITRQSFQRPGRFFQEHRWLFLAGFFSALAILTKQTALAGILASLFFLLFQKRFKQTFLLGTTWGFLAFVPMLVMNFLSRQGFWYHIVTVHQLPWSLENYSKFFSAFIQDYPLFVLPGLSLVFSWAIINMTGLYYRKPRVLAVEMKDTQLLFVLYFLTSLGATISAGTYGGNHNHLLEFSAASALCSGLAFSRIYEAWDRKKAFQWAFPGILLLLCLQVLSLFVGEGRVKPENFPILGAIRPLRTGLELLQANFYNPQWLGLEYRVPPERQKEGLQQVAAFMTNDVGPLIYSDNISLWLSSGKPLLTTDPFTQTHASALGRWDESYLIQLLKTRQFHLVVLRSPIEQRQNATGEIRDIYLSPGLASAILENYKLTQSNVAYIYEPKK